MDKDKVTLSEKEQKLYDYIDKNELNVTTASIKKDLGETYLGAIGRLIRLELVKGEKKMLEEKDPLDPYSRKWTKVYTVIEKGDDNEKET